MYEARQDVQAAMSTLSERDIFSKSMGEAVYKGIWLGALTSLIAIQDKEGPVIRMYSEKELWSTDEDDRTPRFVDLALVCQNEWYLIELKYIKPGQLVGVNTAKREGERPYNRDKRMLKELNAITTETDRKIMRTRLKTRNCRHATIHSHCYRNAYAHNEQSYMDQVREYKRRSAMTRWRNYRVELMLGVGNRTIYFKPEEYPQKEPDATDDDDDDGVNDLAASVSNLKLSDKHNK